MNVEDVFFTIARDIKTRLASESDSKPEVGSFFPWDILPVFIRLLATYIGCYSLRSLDLPGDTVNFLLYIRVNN